MNENKITNINTRKKKSHKSLEEQAKDDLKEYLSNPTKEPDSLISGDMDKIINGTETEENED